MSMTFDSDKKAALSRPDRSVAGSIDEAVKPLCDLINSFNNYFTTSSCAGRIVLMSQPEDHRKDESAWLLVSHDPVDFDTLKSSLDTLPDTEVWFRQESMILHVVCRTHEDAFNLVGAAREVGLKRSGVISFKHNPVVEILGTERMELPIAVGGNVIVTEEYLRIVLDIANRKLERTRKKMKRLIERLS